MNKLLLAVLSLSFLQGALAQDPDAVNPRYQFKGLSFKLDPYQKPEPRDLDDKSVDNLIPAGLPKVVDLIPLQSSVKNQGDRGSCAFFTSTALLESLIKQKQGIEVDISKEYLIWKVKGDMKLNSHSDGSFAHENVQGIVKGGILLERDAPFGPSWFATGLPCAKNKEDDPKTPVSCFAHNKPRAEVLKKVIPATAFTPQVFDVNLGKILEVMAKTKQPVIIGVPVNPKGWNEQTGEAVLNDQMVAECNNTPGLCGGHSILLTGYDQNKRLFTFKNSWDLAWGNKGYGTISFDYVEKFAHNNLVSGSLKSPLKFPADYAVTPVRSGVVNKSVTTLTNGPQGKVVSTSLNVSVKNMNDIVFYTSAYLVTPKANGPISDTNSELVAVLPDLQQANGPYVRAGFNKLFSTDGTNATVNTILNLQENLIDRSKIAGKDLYVRISTYYHSDKGESWIKISRDYKKLNFSL